MTIQVSINGIYIGYVDDTHTFYTKRNALGILGGYCLNCDTIKDLDGLFVEFVVIHHRGMGIHSGKIFKCPLSYFTNSRHYVINPLNPSERCVRIVDMEEISQINPTKFSDEK